VVAEGVAAVQAEAFGRGAGLLVAAQDSAFAMGDDCLSFAPSHKQALARWQPTALKIFGSRLHLLNRSFFPSVHEEVNRRNKEHSHNY
jgi:hypothetical protein